MRYGFGVLDDTLISNNKGFNITNDQDISGQKI